MPAANPLYQSTDLQVKTSVTPANQPGKSLVIIIHAPSVEVPCVGSHTGYGRYTRRSQLVRNFSYHPIVAGKKKGREDCRQGRRRVSDKHVDALSYVIRCFAVILFRGFLL